MLGPHGPIFRNSQTPIPRAWSPSPTAAPPSPTAEPPSPLRGLHPPLQGLHPPLRGLHPHCGVSIPTAGPPSPLWGLPPPLRGLHPHLGASIPHCGVSISTVGPPSPLWGLYLHCGVSIPFLGSPPPIPGTPSLSPGFPTPRDSSVTHVDSWARFGAAQEGFSVHLPPTEAAICLWDTDSGLVTPSLVTSSGTAVSSQARVGGLGKASVLLFPGVQASARCLPECMVPLNQEQSLPPTLSPIPFAPRQGDAPSGLRSPHAASGLPCWSQLGEIMNLTSVSPFSPKDSQVCDLPQALHFRGSSKHFPEFIPSA